MHSTDGNGSKQELKLGLKTLSILLGFLVVGNGALLAVFQTRAKAIAEHAEMEKLALEKRAALTLELALQKQAVENDRAALQAIGAFVQTIDTNQRTLMQNRIPKKKVTAVPAGAADFDFSSIPR